MTTLVKNNQFKRFNRLIVRSNDKSCCGDQKLQRIILLMKKTRSGGHLDGKTTSRAYLYNS